MRKLTAPVLVIASHNKGKLEELSHLLQGYKINLRSASDYALSEPAETENSFIGNAKIKAHFVAEKTRLPALADDSGIEIKCLNGAPGVQTANWAETPKGRDFETAMKTVWKAVLRTDCVEPFRARFVCALALAWPDGHDETFEGVIAGDLTWPPRGNKGHGFDPMFRPDGYKETFGEMDRWEKNIISHRGLAFEKLKAFCLRKIK